MRRVAAGGLEGWLGTPDGPGYGLALTSSPLGCFHEVTHAPNRYICGPGRYEGSADCHQGHGRAAAGQWQLMPTQRWRAGARSSGLAASSCAQGQSGFGAGAGSGPDAGACAMDGAAAARGSAPEPGARTSAELPHACLSTTMGEPLLPSLNSTLPGMAYLDRSATATARVTTRRPRPCAAGRVAAGALHMGRAAGRQHCVRHGPAAVRQRRELGPDHRPLILHRTAAAAWPSGR